MCGKFLITNVKLTNQRTFYMKKPSVGYMKYISNYVDSWGGIIEILGIFRDTVWNIENFSDALENSKDSNVSFDIEKITLLEGLTLSVSRGGSVNPPLTNSGKISLKTMYNHFQTFWELIKWS